MTKERAIQAALDEADRKWDKGLFIAQNHPDYDNIIGSMCVDGIEGDPETVYSIASLYADDVNNDGTWEDAIEAALMEKYPSYF